MKKVLVSFAFVIAFVMMSVVAPISSFAAGPLEGAGIQEESGEGTFVPEPPERETEKETIPLVTMFDVQTMVMDVMDPLYWDDGTIRYRQGNGTEYVDIPTINQVLTEWLFQLEGRELVPNALKSHGMALSRREFVDMLGAVIKAESVSEFCDLFEFISDISEFTGEEFAIPVIIGNNDFITYEAAVKALRQFYWHLHETIGLQEDRTEYVTGRDLYDGFIERYPEYVASQFIRTNYADKDTTVLPAQCATYFQTVALEILGNNEYQNIGMSYEDWLFGLEEGKHITRMRRADVSAILPEELDAALDKFVDFVKVYELGTPEPAPASPAANQSELKDGSGADDHPINVEEPDFVEDVLPMLPISFDGNNLVVTVEIGSDDSTIGSAICTFWVDMSKKAQVDWFLKSLQALMGW